MATGLPIEVAIEAEGVDMAVAVAVAEEVVVEVYFVSNLNLINMTDLRIKFVRLGKWPENY